MYKLKQLCYNIARLDSYYRRFPPCGGGLGMVYHWPKNIVLRCFARLASPSSKNIHRRHWIFGNREPLNEFIFRYRSYLFEREQNIIQAELGIKKLLRELESKRL